MSLNITPSSHQAWLDQVREEIVDPELPVIDAHHHLFHGYGKPVPWQPDYWHHEQARDLGDGHDVHATVFVECGYGYRPEGAAALRPVGETELINRYADEFRSTTGSTTHAAAAIVGFADLRLGAAVDETLEAHLQAAPQRFRGIRQILNWDPSEAVRYPGYDIAPHLVLDASFQEGFSRLARHGLSFDVWLFHPQLPDIVQLAKRFPDTQLVLDHVGGPVGVGPYAGRRAEVMQQWKRDLAALAQCPNIVVKLGGLDMEHAGFHWHERPQPPTSDELLAAIGDYLMHAIDCFGPSRCMFEANFPVDKISCSYRVVWNAYKKLARRFSPEERAQLLYGTAARIYRIPGRDAAAKS